MASFKGVFMILQGPDSDGESHQSSFIMTALTRMMPLILQGPISKLNQVAVYMLPWQEADGAEKDVTVGDLGDSETRRLGATLSLTPTMGIPH